MNAPQACHPERSEAPGQSEPQIAATRIVSAVFFRALALGVALLSGTLLSAWGQQTTPQTPPPPAPANIPQSNPVAPTPVTMPPQQTPTLAQQQQQEQQLSIAPPTPFDVALPRSHNPLSPYRPSTVPPVNLYNSPRLENLMRDGKLYVSLQDAIALAIENNLDLASFRYNLPTALTDLARTKAGGVSLGVNTSVTSPLGASGPSTPGGGVVSSGAGAAGQGGLVQSTLGEGTYVNPFDPVFTVKGLVDHTKSQEFNPFLYGVPLLETNTIGYTTQYTEYFPTGTGIQWTLNGQRQTSNSPLNIVDPAIQLFWQGLITQPLLAGFGTGTNKRWIRIAKRNLQITNYAFDYQVITTVTGVEDIYWDLVNAYEDEQIKERSLAFANQTLGDDQKQLELKAIPALQVMTDQSAVANAEGNLTISRANRQAAELNLKNALTRADNPTIDDMPVIPLDFKGAPDPNENRSIDELIAEAEKNRPDVAQDQIGMQIAQENLKAVNNSLLPQLNAYGLFAGTGNGGPLNPYCDQGSSYCSTTLPSGTPGVLKDAFNYSAPEYQVGFTLNITIRNRIQKADQFRAQLAFRQSQIAYEQQKKTIRFDVRNSQFALEQAEGRIEAAQKARDLAQRSFEITRQEQKLGAKSSVDTLNAESALAVAESALDAAQTNFEKAKVDIDRATGTTLDLTHVSIDDAKSGIVTHGP
ncbi:MAG TPA: TolC family protein [Acidobacteriaceae bacterium]|nr:TolC family protein [Acidobacteriaceae bacterium]